MTSYCEVAPGHPFHGPYHDTEYGFPSRSDAVLFERLVLEINQAGLSWLTVLKKRENFRRAYDQFDVDKVANYGEEQRQRLLHDAGIIRNRLKVDAAIYNARQLIPLIEEHGSFAAWLDSQHPLTKSEWVDLFRRQFKFVGGEIVGEFLMSLGYLPGAHVESCPIYGEIALLTPPWMAR